MMFDNLMYMQNNKRKFKLNWKKKLFLYRKINKNFENVGNFSKKDI